MARGKKPADKRRITELTVRKAKAKGRAHMIWDSQQRGLALRIQPTGAKSWVVVYSRHGRGRWLTLGNAADIHLADARIMAAEAMLAAAKGKDPAAEKRAERTAGSFADLHAQYLEVAKKKNKSWRQGASLVQRFAIPKWGKLPAASITRGDVKTMMKKVTAPIVFNQTLAAVSAVFSWGVKEEIVTANPCRSIDRNPTQDRERTLPPSELPLFWNAFAAAGTEGAALKAILCTGQRPGECARMRREHIKDGWWTMPGEPVRELGWLGTKNKKNHKVWLPAPVRELITGKTAVPTTGFVFAGKRGGPVGELDATMRNICAELTKQGIEPAKPHDLRRTFASTVTGMKFGRDAMNRILNHREGGIADVYDRAEYEAENKQIMEAVAARIVALVEGRGGDNVVQGHFGSERNAPTAATP